MYNINRSNLLSIETIKMYLYDLAILGNAKNQLDLQISKMVRQKNHLGKRRKFDDREYLCRYEEVDEYVWLYLRTVFWTCAVFGALEVLIAWRLGRERYQKYIMSLTNEDLIVLLVFILVAIPLIIVLGRELMIKRNNHKVKIEENEAFQEFEEKEKKRLAWEQQEIIRIDKNIRILKSRRSAVEKEIQNQFALDILHNNYQDTSICGVMYQLFDTGRVFNLTEAMNLYEDLKWKTEMKALLQSLIDKVDDLLSVQRNIEYYTRCISNNQQETHRMLQEVSMNQQRIQDNQHAIDLNVDVIRRNTDTMRMLAEYNFIQSNR